jgi:alanine racemase
MAGWADGYCGSPQAGSVVLLHARRCPVLALSANTTLVDVTGNAPVAAGEVAVLLGGQGDALIDAEELGRASGGVYRLLAGIPARVSRLWT